MECGNKGTLQLTWGIWGGGDFNKISLHHCSEKALEKEVVLTEEFVKAPDLYEFLNKYCKNNPTNHDSSPCRFTYSGDICDFSQSELRKVDNSLSVACNCRCKFCFKHSENNSQLQNEVDESWENSTFSIKTYFDTFQRLKGHHLWMLRATDNGEPLLYKKELLSFLSTCTKDDFEVFGITTNGELLDKEFIDKLREYSEKGQFRVQIQVSLNAFYTETRKNLMCSQRDIEEIKDLIKYMKSTTDFWVHASIVAMPENEAEISLLDNWCKENKVCFISSPAYSTQWKEFGEKYAAWKPYN